MAIREVTFRATELDVGFHPDGYMIDKTASPMNRYSKWEISPLGYWHNPKPVCFDSMPQDGWFKQRRVSRDKTGSKTR